MGRKKVLYGILVLLVLLNSCSAMISFSAVASSDSPSSIHHTVSFDEPILSDVELNENLFTKIYLSDCISSAMPGDPALPVYTARILLPYGKTIHQLSVNYGQYKEIHYDLINKPIVPEQAPISGSEPDELEITKNDDVYLSSDSVLADRFQVTYCRLWLPVK